MKEKKIVRSGSKYDAQIKAEVLLLVAGGQVVALFPKL